MASLGQVTTITSPPSYIIVSVCLVIGHWLAHLLSWAKTRHLLGICYIMVKVALLMVAEVRCYLFEDWRFFKDQPIFHFNGGVHNYT